MRIPTLLLAATLVAFTLPATAQVSVNIQLPGLIQVAPPPPRYERVPVQRAGQAWVPGHWQWNERAYAWRQGYWQQARPDYIYAPGRWVRADGGWRWADGDWRRAPKYKNKRSKRDHRDREERHEHRQRYDRDHGGPPGGGYHCPPGQAKKGRC